ncbi:MAG: lipoyl(octanoyl) transferase LipB [Bacteroidales bacterium]|nr:lipoyl(octanoyl) transferase LipB [Bacteroidales bacterium]
MNILFEDLGIIEYKEAWEYQKSCYQRIIQAKDSDGETDVSYHFLFCEHPHVFTLGKSGQPSNLLIKQDYLKSIGAAFYKTDRGGDITYHGPGQIVGYPIIDLEQMKMGVKLYINNLEECIILTLRDFKITAERMDNATGVWLDVNNKDKAKKICAIGVRVSRYVTMHGFALNVNTDMKYFSYINPCGLGEKGVTSMEQELGKRISMKDVKQSFQKHFCKVFDLNTS